MTKISDYEDPLQFAALIAHQLKSPVSAAGSLLKTVLDEYAGRLTPRQKDLLSRVDGRLEQALNTVRRMLAILRPESGEGAAGGFCEAASVLHLRIRRHIEEASGRGIALTLECQQQPAYARISEAAFSEACDALLNNALKYTPDQGTIRIRLTEVPGDEDQIRMSLADSGIGIPEQYREKVFEPFFRTAEAQSTALPGTGLGLAFVRAVVDAVGGTIRVEQSDLGGADFILDLPRLSEEEIERDIHRPDVFNRTRVVIIGGVAAGPKVASKVIRMDPDVEVTVIEREAFLSYSGCGLPYYVSGVVEDQRALMASSLGAVRDPVFFQNVKHVNVLNRTEALEIDRARKRVRVRHLEGGHESWIPYDKLVICTGSIPVRPPIPRSDLRGIFTLHGMRDAEGIKSHLAAEKARDVVIVGGGLIGVEMTEALAVCGCRVTIIEKDTQILSILDWEMAKLLERHMEAHGVRVLTETKAIGFEGTDSIEAVLTDKGRIPADMVILSVGVRPNVDLARRAALEIGETGAIRVNNRLQTSDEDIYAAGDCIESPHLVTGRPCYMPLGSIANKQGRVVAVNVCGGDEIFPGVAGSCVCKVFEYCVARTGLGETSARDAGFEPVCVLLPSLDREHFLPGASYLMTKLIVDRTSRCILGAQCLGPGNADKRVDVITTAITAGMTVDLVSNLDLCYAPAYSLAMDNLITAANVAKNKLSGAMKSITPIEAHKKIQAKEDIILLDVSSPRENEEVRIPGARLIPLGSLRVRLKELPFDKTIIVFCRISLRGYEAALILQSAGFQNVYVLDGGVEMWPYDKVCGRQ